MVRSYAEVEEHVINGWLQVAKTDLLERPLEKAVSTACYETPIHKHGIVTLLIRK